jgi:putative transposase
VSEGDDKANRQGPRYWTGAHTKHRLRFHIVFVPKYRKRVLRGSVAVRLRELIEQACEVPGWGLRELNVQVDHVHLLVQISPSESVSQVVKSLKGGTSRVLRSEFPELEEFLWGASFWARGFFAETVGKGEESTVQAYIREQRP